MTSSKVHRKNLPSEIESLEAHASQLLDSFIQLRQRYSILDPMIFDKDLVETRGNGSRGVGFNILRDTILLVCAQQISAICFDNSSKTPSIKKLMGKIQEDRVKSMLRRRFLLPSQTPIKTDDPVLIEAHENLKKRRAEEAAQKFDSLLLESDCLWNKISSDERVHAFKQVRDKISAHSEIMFCAESQKFKPFDIAETGLKWGDLKSTINDMQNLVELIGLLVRNSSFAWETLDEQVLKISYDFWN
jgi:hypothetical protein